MDSSGDLDFLETLRSDAPPPAAFRAAVHWLETASAAALATVEAWGPVGAWALAHRANVERRYAEAKAWAEGGEEGPPAVRARAALEGAVASYALGDMRGCLDLCRAAGQLTHLDPVLRAELEAQEAVACRQLGMRSRAVSLNLDAMKRLPAAPQEPEVRELLMTIHNNLASTYVVHGDIAAAVDHLRQAVALSAGYEGRASVAVVQRVNLGKLLVRLGQRDEALALFDDAVRRAEALDPEVATRAAEGLAHGLRAVGRLEEARDVLRPIVEHWGAAGRPLHESHTALALGQVLAELGDPEAESLLRRAITQAERVPANDVLLQANDLLARVLEREGRAVEACVVLREHARLQRLAYEEGQGRVVEELRVAHDIERRERETEELRTQATTLHRMVAERTQALQERSEELERAMVAAQRANEAKSTFLAVISHELRTPLSGILGYLEIVLDDLADGATPDAGDVERARRSALRLQRLVERILAFTQVEQSVSPTTERIELLPLLRAIADEAGDEGVVPVTITVDSTAAGRLLVDSATLKLALAPLIENAIRFTGQGEVRVHAEHTGDRLQISVDDTGPGIPDADIARLFEAFEQLDPSYSRRHDGLGLGLAVCRRCTEALGGAVTCSSELGRGTRFTVDVPTAPPS